MLADRNLEQLSSERLNPAADLDRYRPINKQWMELGDSYGRVGGRIAGPREIRTPQEDQTSQLTWILRTLRI